MAAWLSARTFGSHPLLNLLLQAVSPGVLPVVRRLTSQSELTVSETSVTVLHPPPSSPYLVYCPRVMGLRGQPGSQSVVSYTSAPDVPASGPGDQLEAFEDPVAVLRACPPSDCPLTFSHLPCLQTVWGSFSALGMGLWVASRRLFPDVPIKLSPVSRLHSCFN